MKILVYNPSNNRMETYYRELSDPMPFSQDKYLSVREFRGSSKSDTLWTDRRAIEAFNKLRSLYGKPIKVGYAFKRIGEGGHSGMSQHYAGVAFDIAQGMPAAERDKIRNLAIKYKMFNYVEPAYLTPTWVRHEFGNNSILCILLTYDYINKWDKEKGILSSVQKMSHLIRTPKRTPTTAHNTLKMAIYMRFLHIDERAGSRLNIRDPALSTCNKLHTYK
ncbi:MAG: hypothetical protein PHP54_04295 [Clostridia bacterium]|nr:hypothetical protein [Clostridia bacterium]